MFLIWSGWGFLTILIVMVTSIAIGGLLQAILVAVGRPDLTYLAISAGIFAAAAANWMVGKRMNGAPPRVLLDTATNERVVLQRRHKLFWIRMEYWSIPVALMAFVPLLALFGK